MRRRLGRATPGPLGHLFKQANNERENRNNKKTSRAIRHTAATHCNAVVTRRNVLLPPPPPPPQKKTSNEDRTRAQLLRLMKPPQSRPIYSHIAADFIFFLPRNLLRVAAIKNVFAFHFLSLNKCAASIRRLSHHRAIRPSFPVRIRLPPLAAHYLFGTADMQRHLISFLVSCLQLAEGKSQSRQTSKGNKRAALRLCLLEESRRADRLVCHFSFVSCAPQQHPEQWQSVNASDMNGRHPEPSFSGLPHLCVPISF